MNFLGLQVVEEIAGVTDIHGHLSGGDVERVGVVARGIRDAGADFRARIDERDMHVPGRGGRSRFPQQMYRERSPGKSRANDGDAPYGARGFRGFAQDCGADRSVASGLHAQQYPEAAVTESIPYRFEMGYVRM